MKRSGQLARADTERPRGLAELDNPYAVVADDVLEPRRPARDDAAGNQRTGDECEVHGERRVPPPRGRTIDLAATAEQRCEGPVASRGEPVDVALLGSDADPAVVVRRDHGPPDLLGLDAELLALAHRDPARSHDSREDTRAVRDDRDVRRQTLAVLD